MFSTPPCPPLVVGRPFLQLDHGRACWATDNLSAVGLRAWLRLLTYFRNDRPIPRLSIRELARITGLALSSAHKVSKELEPVVRFSDPATGEATGGAFHATNSLRSQGERPAPKRSGNEQQRSPNEQQRSAYEHPSLVLKEEIQEGRTPPPTSPSCPVAADGVIVDQEQERVPGGRIGVERACSPPLANSHQRDPSPPPSLPPSPALAQAMQDRCLTIHPQLEPVREELLAFWAGKEGNRSPLAFSALQGELCRIEADAAGGIEQVREQLSVAAQKGWDFIRHTIWQTWRLAHPQPIHLSEEDLTAGGIYPELAAFERRYRASYNPKASGGEVFGAFWNYTERLKREQAAPDLQSAA